MPPTPQCHPLPNATHYLVQITAKCHPLHIATRCLMQTTANANYGVSLLLFNEDLLMQAGCPVTLRVRLVGDHLRSLWGYQRLHSDHSVIKRYLVHAANTSLPLNGRREVLHGCRLVGDSRMMIFRGRSKFWVVFSSRRPLVVSD